MLGPQAAPRKKYLRRLGFALVLSGCAPSAEDVKQEFDAYVANANQCEETAECTLATAGCPLGCVAAVRVEAKADVERKARELIEDYESGGTVCEYECVAVSGAECRDGRCALAE